VEVLLRVQEENGKLASPGAFISAAERYGLMPALDRHVIEHGLAALSSCPLDACPMLAINVSGHTIEDDGFREFVEGQFRKYRIDHSRICFEITETSAISRLVVAEQFIHQFRELGCRFALDDFGSGMSPFAYLKRLRVDYLKIHGAFVRNLLVDRFDQNVIQAVQYVARNMELQTVAEYAENDAIVDELRRIGVDFAQGYGVHVPQPLDELLGLKTPGTQR